MSQFSSIKGMHDILPEQSFAWRELVRQCSTVCLQHGYQRIMTPMLEQRALFKRSVGDVTDIVEKELYEFIDQGGDELCLRPEGTASVVRAAIQHRLLDNQQTQRLWYFGPMFRRERPQTGRYRQFYQVGVEAYGFSSPTLDAELLLLSHRLWQWFGIDQQVKLQINSLGSYAARNAYREILQTYFGDHYAALDADSQRRLTTNPLRILDSKNPELATLIANAPSILDYLDEDSQAHFARVQALLIAADVPFTVNPRLVRGLDYYNSTVFEWVTDELGAQGTVCAGGRYDGLVERLGGPDTPAMGFAMGVERLLLLMHGKDMPTKRADVFIITQGDEAEAAGLVLANQLRAAAPTLEVVLNLTGGSFKSQFKRADKSGAKVALVLAAAEVAKGQVTVKTLSTGEQQTLDHASAIRIIPNIINA